MTIAVIQMSKPEFRVYITNQPLCDENPVILIAVIRIGDTLISETYFFIHDAGSTFYKQIVTAKKLTIRNVPIVIDADFMFRDAALCAKNRLNHHAYRRFRNSPHILGNIRPYELLESEPWILLHMHLRSSYRGRLTTVAGNTKSAALARFLRALRGFD